MHPNTKYFFERLCLFTILNLFLISITPKLKLLLSMLAGCLNFAVDEIYIFLFFFLGLN